MPSSVTSDSPPIDDDAHPFHNGCSPFRSVLPGLREGKRAGGNDDLVLVHMSGATQSKASWLQDIADETMRYYKIDVTKFDCSVEGDRAIVKATNVIEARIWESHSPVPALST